MSSSKQTAEQILTEVQDVADARMRPMMGGWLLYVQETLVGQIDDDELFVKENSFTKTFAADLPRVSSYSGAEPAVLVKAARRGQTEWLQQLLAGSVTALRAKRKEKPAADRQDLLAPAALSGFARVSRSGATNLAAAVPLPKNAAVPLPKKWDSAERPILFIGSPVQKSGPLESTRSRRGRQLPGTILVEARWWLELMSVLLARFGG